jgi:hypothetical protein
VGAGVAEDPAGAVDEQDGRQLLFGADRSDDAHPHVADLGGDGGPLLLDMRLVDRRGLDVVEHLAGAVGPELVQKGGWAAASANSRAAGSRMYFHI